MHKLEIKLKQHTPLIHFQHDQDGATLRASEVKPKLDKFILGKLGEEKYNEFSNKVALLYDKNNSPKNFSDLTVTQRKYEVGIFVAKQNGWLVGKGDHPALDYKMRIEGENRFNEVKLSVKQNNKGKYYTYYLNVQGKENGFPFLLANMGGKDTEEDLMNLSQFQSITLILVTSNENEDLVNEINNNIESFFALNNFGQRETKGFGSFSVLEKCINGQAKVVVNWEEKYKSYYENGTPVFKFPLNIKDNEFEKQLMLFSVIDFYWKCLKSGINYSKRQVPRNGIGDVIIRNRERYIKAFLWTYLNSKGYTWEKRKIKRDLHLETPFPQRTYGDNANNAVFARGMMGCPDKYEYRIPQNKFREDRNRNQYKEIVENHTVKIDNISQAIERISSPIIFKPIVDGNCVSVYILFDKELIDRLHSLPERQRVFSFSEGRNQVPISIVPESINYKELIREFHVYFFTNERFVSSTLGEYINKRWQPARIIVNRDKQGKEISRKWGNMSISEKMVPRNFAWENILDSSDNGQNRYVSLSQIEK